jgi:hypothetical protein
MKFACATWEVIARFRGVWAIRGVRRRKLARTVRGTQPSRQKDMRQLSPSALDLH